MPERRCNRACQSPRHAFPHDVLGQIKVLEGKPRLSNVASQSVPDISNHYIDIASTVPSFILKGTSKRKEMASIPSMC
jgi:hypothetical protein